MQTSAWSAWEERPSEPIIRYKRMGGKGVSGQKPGIPDKPDLDDITSEKERNETKPEKEEEDPNPIGPYGFPLYSDKYNPKPLPKYNPGIICYASSKTHISNSWIIDSGASELISGNKNYFSSLYHCIPISIGLPNGNSLTVSMKGTVHINSSIIIDNVYFSSDFHVNLISVSKLTTISKFDISFTDGHAVLFDKVMMKEAGRANLVKGLYLLSHAPGSNSPDSFVGVTSPEI